MKSKKWETKKLGEVCDVLNGLWAGKKPPFINVNVIRNTNFSKDGVIDYSDIADIKVEKNQFLSRRLIKGDIILEKSGGGPKQPVGRVVLFNRTEDNFSFSNFTSALRIKDEISLLPEFLHIFLHNFYITGGTEKMQKHSTGIRNLIMDEYKDINLAFPDKQEQRKIVKKLDKLFLEIDKAKQIAQANLQNAKEFFNSKLNSVFNNPQFSWDMKTLSQEYDVRDGTHDSPKYISSGFPLVTSKNLKNGNLDMDDIKFISESDYNKINERSKVSKGDILFAMIGTIGNPVIVETKPKFAIKNVALFKLSKRQNSSFLKYYLLSDKVIKKMLSEAKGTTQRFVGLGYLRNFPIPMTSITVQQKIVTKLDKLSAETKKMEEIYKKKIEDLEELKKSLLKQAFEGKLV